MKKSERTVTPKLRFPEFRGSEPWKRKKLSDFLIERKQRNRKLKYSAQEVLSVSGEHGCVNQIKLLGRSYAGASVKEYHIVEAGDIVYTKSPLKKNPFGIIKENKGKPGIVSTLYAVYRSTDDGHPSYLDHYFSSDYNLNSYLEPIVKKGAKNDMKVNNTAVLDGEVFAPTLPEQQKIAECLSSLDGLIAAERRKLEAFKTHKKGLMQQLFPQPGQTQPQLRFPEFRDKGEWTRHTLSHYVSALDAGVSVNGGDRPARKGEIGVLKTSCVTTGTFDHTENKVVLEPEELGRVKEFVQRDTVIMSRMNTIELVGANAYVEREITNLYLPDRLWAAKPTANGNMRFLSYVLGSEQGRSFLSRLASGSSGTMKSISKSEVFAMPTLVTSIAEQQKIAACLTALDTQIAAQATKIGTLKSHKRGLMQQLFPAPEAS